MFKTIVNFFRSGIGKLFIIGIVVSSLYIMKIQLDKSHAKLELKEKEIIVLQNKNKQQHESIDRLLAFTQKQDEVLIKYEQDKEQITKTLQQKEHIIRQYNDEKSQNWKKQNLPDTILSVLNAKS